VLNREISGAYLGSYAIEHRRENDEYRDRNGVRLHRALSYTQWETTETNKSRPLPRAQQFNEWLPQVLESAVRDLRPFAAVLDGIPCSH
jgi:hypothetical protein